MSRNPRAHSRHRAVRGALRLREAVRRQVGRLRPVWPGVGMVRFGGLRRLSPISRAFGEDRGLPIDRYYIEHFLARHSGQDQYNLGDIRGHVLEISEGKYARMFGGWGTRAGRIEKLDVLSADQGNPRATLIADLTAAPQIPSETFDCVICTQTLHLIYDIRSAIAEIHRIVKPGGVVLVTAPGISQICRRDADSWGDHWRFTTRGLRRLFEEYFPPEGVTVEAYGNVLASIAFLEGIATEELKKHELDVRDPDYELVVTVRARR